VAPEVARRLGALAAEPDDAFALTPDGVLLWRGEAAGTLAGDQPFNPVVRLYGELGPEPARARAARRLEAFVAAEAGRRLRRLKALGEAIASGAVKGLARGLAWRLVETGGVLDRRGVEAELRSLSSAERRTLRGLGVRIGAFSLLLPSQAAPEARAFAQAFALQAPSPARALGLRGLLAVGGLTVPAAALERLDEQLRAGGMMLSDEARAALGWSEDEARRILRDLGFTPARRAESGGRTLWRRRTARPAPPRADKVAPASPFAALAALKAAPAPIRRRRRKPRAERG